MIHEKMNKLNFINIKKKSALWKNMSREREDKSQIGRKNLQKTHLKKKDSYPKHTKNFLKIQ